MGTDVNIASKYFHVEQVIKQSIDRGIYRNDEKLPSIRAMSEQLKVSKNTVIRAYQELEAQGVIYAIAKSGYRVAQPDVAISSTTPPKEVDLLSVCKEILTYTPNDELLAAGSAHPFTDTATIRSLYAEIGRHSRKQSYIPSHYQLPPGNALLVKQLARITNSLGVNASTEEISVTHGAQQAISLALRALTKPGDIVAVESPCYFGNFLLLESLHLKVVEVPSCPRTGMDPAALKEVLNQWDVAAIIITPNFTNPTGACMPADKRQAILDASRDIPIIEDDVFGELSDEQSLTPLKSLDEKQRVIYVNSLSKNLDSRLRIGWIIAGRYQEKIEKFLVSDNMGSLNLMQSAVGEFLSSGKYRQHIQRMRRHYNHNCRQLHSELTKALNEEKMLKGRYQLHRPQGSFLLWLMLPSNFDSYQLYQDCRTQGINILPGTVFGTDNQYRHCVRLSCANILNNKNWEQGVKLLVDSIAAQLNKSC